MPTVSKDPVENLSVLALFISTDVQNALNASLVRYAANAWIEQYPEAERRKLFRTHPSNNIVYSGIAALEEQAVVHIAEALKDEHRLHPINVNIRRKVDLALHRDALSHPMTVKWRRPESQTFSDSDRKWYDLRPALVWDLQCSINEELVKYGRAVYVEGVRATEDMAGALHLILDLSRLPDVAIPTRPQLLAYLVQQAPKFQSRLEEHPDGHRNVQAEEARVERKRRQGEKWKKDSSSRRE